MGCWNESDAITHTPLESGDPVVMVVLTERGRASNWWMGSWWDIPRDIEAVYKGKYNDYGWIKDVPFDDNIRPDARSVFFHQDTWNAILEKYGAHKNVNLTAWHFDNEIIPDFLDELVTVMNFASSARLHLSCGLPYKGAQSNYREDRKAMNFYVALVGAALMRMDEQYVDHGGTLPLTENED